MSIARKDRSSSPKPSIVSTVKDDFQTPEANINVVVRIRPILQKEIQSN